MIFSWDYYSVNPGEIINLRHGGLGIIGGITAGIITLIIFCRKRKQSALLMLDTVTMSMLIGQILGRWGNFFNREAFGGYTNGPLAMQIPLGYFEETGRLSEIRSAGLLDHLVKVAVNGQSLLYIQVHPTFLYEGLWNLMILIIIFFYRKHKKFDGELVCIYFIGYGLGPLYDRIIADRPASDRAYRDRRHPGGMYRPYHCRNPGHGFWTYHEKITEMLMEEIK